MGGAKGGGAVARIGGLVQLLQFLKSRRHIICRNMWLGREGRVGGEWGRFKMEETLSLVISREVPSWAAWRKDN